MEREKPESSLAVKGSWAIIPARGGSKGIPDKNLRNVAGKTLLEWVIAAAREAEEVNEVVVSTDSEEIARVAEAAGAVPVRRPAELAGDEEPSETAILHVIEETGPSVPDITVFLQCTSPLTTAGDIDATVRLLRETGADAAFTASRFRRFLWTRTNEGVAPLNHPLGRRERRQDREGELLETGAVYVMRTEGFVESRHRFFGKIVVHEVPATRSLEVDEWSDLAMADALLRLERPTETSLPWRPEAIVFDFDGVLTDNKVIVSGDGESVRCDRSDGLGVEMLREAGFPMLIVSRETDDVVRARGAKLGIETRSGIRDKVAVVSSWLEEHDATWDRTIYVGNDVNDLECMRRAGYSVAVADAWPQVTAQADLLLSRGGGKGAVRELAEVVLRQSGGIA